MSSESLRTVRDRFSEFIERVQAHHERVVVTKNGTPAAVLISPEDLESLEETLAVLGDSDAVADLVEAHRAVSRRRRGARGRRRQVSPAPVTEPRYGIVVTSPAARAIRETLPEAVAFAVIDFITGPLLDDPRRVGAPLRNELEGVWSARRGTYRILYRIDDDRREVIVLRVGHRRDIYRTR